MFFISVVEIWQPNFSDSQTTEGSVARTDCVFFSPCALTFDGSRPTRHSPSLVNRYRSLSSIDLRSVDTSERFVINSISRRRASRSSLYFEHTTSFIGPYGGHDASSFTFRTIFLSLLSLLRATNPTQVEANRDSRFATTSAGRRTQSSASSACIAAEREVESPPPVSSRGFVHDDRY